MTSQTEPGLLHPGYLPPDLLDEERGARPADGTYRAALLALECRARGEASEVPAVSSDDASLAPPLSEQLDRIRSAGEGRIPWPEHVQVLWAHHKYAVLARSPERYRQIGRSLAHPGTSPDFPTLLAELVELTAVPAPEARARNTLDHMWGYVSEHLPDDERRRLLAAPGQERLDAIARLARDQGLVYLLHSTALADLY